MSTDLETTAADTTKMQSVWDASGNETRGKTVASEAELRAAVAQGGDVVVRAGATIELGEMLEITADCAIVGGPGGGVGRLRLAPPPLARRRPPGAPLSAGGTRGRRRRTRRRQSPGRCRTTRRAGTGAISRATSPIPPSDL